MHRYIYIYICCLPDPRSPPPPRIVMSTATREFGARHTNERTGRLRRGRAEQGAGANDSDGARCLYLSLSLSMSVSVSVSNVSVSLCLYVSVAPARDGSGATLFRAALTPIWSAAARNLRNGAWDPVRNPGCSARHSHRQGEVGGGFAVLCATPPRLAASSLLA